MFSSWPVERPKLDGSRQRSFGQKGIRPGAGEHRDTTTIRRREVGAGNGKGSRVEADRSSGSPPTPSEAIGDRWDKLITRIPSIGQIDRQTNRGRVSSSRVFAPYTPQQLKSASLHGAARPELNGPLIAGPVDLRSRAAKHGQVTCALESGRHQAV